jgi:hypothetical protein
MYLAYVDESGNARLPGSRTHTLGYLFFDAAGIAHHRMYVLRDTYATWSLAAGVDERERALLDAYSRGGSGGC